MTSRALTLLSVLSLLLAGIVGAQAQPSNMIQTETGQTRGVQPVPPDRGIIVDPLPPHYRPGQIDVRVWTNRSSYRIGEDVRIYFRVDRSSFIYIFSTDPMGVTRQIFPNRYDPDNRVRPGVTYSLPDRNYRLVADGPPGRDTIYAVATTERYGWVHEWYGTPGSGGDPFPIRSHSQAPEQLFDKLNAEAENQAREQLRLETQDNAQARSGAHLRIQVSPRPPWNAPAIGRAWHTIQITGDGWWRPPYDRDDYWRGSDPDRNKPYSGVPSELSLRTSPRSARVYLNGQYYGRTPLDLELPPGYYDIMLELPGYDRWERRIRLEKGARESYSIRLQR